MKKKAFHQDGDEMSANAPDYHKTSGKLNNSLPLIAHVVIILRDVTNYHCHISPHRGGSRQRLLHTVTGVKARIKPSRKLHLN